MKTISESFGSLVFDDRAMKARLSGEVYHAMKQTIKQGQPLDPAVANAVAAAMRDWAVERGATHFTHWFQPLTGVTAEKHDGEFRLPLVLAQASPIFHSSCEGKLGIALE